MPWDTKGVLQKPKTHVGRVYHLPAKSQSPCGAVQNIRDSLARRMGKGAPCPSPKERCGHVASLHDFAHPYTTPLVK